jgi:hypothetical protein
MSAHATWLLVLLLACGCSGAVSSPASGDAGTRDSASSDSQASDTSLGGCPASEPASGSTCMPGGQPASGCEYGTDPHCTVIASCSAPGPGGPFTWQLTGPDPSCAGNPQQCPASYGMPINGAACPLMGTCSYPEGRCTCAPCFGDGGRSTEWECATWQTPAGCPEPRPLLGTACSQPGQACNYGQGCCSPVDTGPDLYCQNGIWTAMGVGCDCAQPICGH